MQAELQHYWKLMKEGCERFYANPLDPEIDNIVDDIELLWSYTEWPKMRAMCARALALDAQLRHPLLAAAEHREAL